MNEQDQILLAQIQRKCKKEPKFLTYIINAGVNGICEAEQEMRNLAIDMEIMASAMCFLAGQSRVSSELKKRMSDLALSKLEKHNFDTFINWSQNIVKNSLEKEK